MATLRVTEQGGGNQGAEWGRGFRPGLGFVRLAVMPLLITTAFDRLTLHTSEAVLQAPRSGVARNVSRDIIKGAVRDNRSAGVPRRSGMPEQGGHPGRIAALPGSHVTDHQARRPRTLRRSHGPAAAAAMAGFSLTTGAGSRPILGRARSARHYAAGAGLTVPARVCQSR